MNLNIWGFIDVARQKQDYIIVTAPLKEIIVLEKRLYMYMYSNWLKIISDFLFSSYFLYFLNFANG